MVLLEKSNKDLHRFVWRSHPEHYTNYCMTRVTLGVAASFYAANMVVKQNAADISLEFPAAAATVDKSFYC